MVWCFLFLAQGRSTKSHEMARTKLLRFVRFCGSSYSRRHGNQFEHTNGHCNSRVVFGAAQRDADGVRESYRGRMSEAGAYSHARRVRPQSASGSAGTNAQGDEGVCGRVEVTIHSLHNSAGPHPNPRRWNSASAKPHSCGFPVRLLDQPLYGWVARCHNSHQEA